MLKYWSESKYSKTIKYDCNSIINFTLKDGSSKLNVAFDPSNFLFTQTYGEAPSNTILTVNYLVGGGITANVSANTINEGNTLDITQNPNLVVPTANFIRESKYSFQRTNFYKKLSRSKWKMR